MIEAINVTKYFGTLTAVDHITVEIKEGFVFGLVGSNGAGKSTFLRMLCGILKPDEGSIQIDDDLVFENPKAKSKFFYITDEPYFLGNSTPKELMNYYSLIYQEFDKERFQKMLGQFDLDIKRKINTFSKGMKKQLSILCGICANTKYLVCDETFDGLDPVMRQAMKSIFAKEIDERGFTPVIASHNLRELEDICDHIGLLHKGGVLLSKDLDDMRVKIHKMQFVLREGTNFDQIFEGTTLLKKDVRGSLYTVTARGTREEWQERLEKANPIFYEILPLTLEEIFISETEVAGYDIKKLIY